MHDGAVLITGAARRIGAAIARTLHAAGARVILHCHRSRSEADRLAEHLNQERADSCAVVQCDLLDDSALAREHERHFLQRRILLADSIGRAFLVIDQIVGGRCRVREYGDQCPRVIRRATEQLCFFAAECLVQ